MHTMSRGFYSTGEAEAEFKKINLLCRPSIRTYGTAGPLVTNVQQEERNVYVLCILPTVCVQNMSKPCILQER